MSDLTITLQNVEDVVFYDKALQQRLSDFRDLFHSWAISKSVPSMQFLGKKALLDFLEQVEDRHLQVISSHLKANVKVVPVDVHLVKDYEFNVEESEQELNRMQIKGNYFIYRDANKLYLNSWR